MPTWTSWRTSLRVRSQEFGWRPKPAKSGGHFGILRPLREERTWDQISEPLPSDVSAVSDAPRSTPEAYLSLNTGRVRYSTSVSGYLHGFRHSPEMYLTAGASLVMGLHRQIQVRRPLRLAIYRQLGCSFRRVTLKQACVGYGQCHPNSMPFSQQQGRGID